MSLQNPELKKQFLTCAEQGIMTIQVAINKMESDLKRVQPIITYMMEKEFRNMRMRVQRLLKDIEALPL